MGLPLNLSTEAGDPLTTEEGNALVGERSYPPYLGYNIFDFPVNWSDNPREQITRSMTILENETGRPTVRSHTTTPVPDFRIKVALEGRDQIRMFHSWSQVWRGRQVPVWFPTWCRDLELVSNVVGNVTSIESVGYTANLWPHNARKHVALIFHDRTIRAVRVSSSSDNGSTESWTITPTLAPENLNFRHTMCSFLILARLMDDGIRVEYFGRDYAEVQMHLYEVPREVPLT